MNAATVIRVILALGIVNLVTGALVFFTCRCQPGPRIGKRFPRFYKAHCYLWRVFWASVIVHAILAIVYVGVPF